MTDTTHTDKSAAPPAAAQCDCISKVDALLVERNTRIALPIIFGEGQIVRPCIVTEQIERGRGKKKAFALFATVCPFCGTSYKP